MGEPQMPPMPDASPVSPEPPMEGPDMGEEQMPPMPEGPENGSGSEIDDLYNSLSDDDKKAAKKYIESMADKSSEEPEDNTDMGGEQMPPMQESVIFSKKQIKALKEGLNDIEGEEKRNLSKKTTINKRETPFSAPQFK